MSLHDNDHPEEPIGFHFQHEEEKREMEVEEAETFRSLFNDKKISKNDVGVASKTKSSNSKSEDSLKEESQPLGDISDMPKGKVKITNKERARKARQRKKKYYEDLEDRVTALEKENINLKQELEYCKQKINFLNKGVDKNVSPVTNKCVPSD